MAPNKNFVRLHVEPGRIDGAGVVAAAPLSRQVARRETAVIVNGAQTYREFRKAFGELAEDGARRAYLDTIDRAITAKTSDTSSWASLYEAADFIREHEEFWKELGFSSFDDYWRDRVGEYFSDWRELEMAYNYAVLACPELFAIDWNEASQMAQHLNHLRQIEPLAEHGSNQHVKRTHTGHYLSEDDAARRVAQAAAWENLGSTSLEYRVGKIRRERPDVYDRMLKREFFKKTHAGKVMIDLKGAEAAARLDKPRVRPKKEQLSRGKQLATGVKNQLKESNTSQRVFIDELLNIPWVIKALKARGWERR
jgi:hypothetical protein